MPAGGGSAQGGQMRSRGEGVQNWQNFADVFYGWPLIFHSLPFTGNGFDTLL